MAPAVLVDVVVVRWSRTEGVDTVSRKTSKPRSMDHHNPQSRGTKQQQRPQPNNHQDFFLRFKRLKHVLLVPVPPITTRTRRRTTSQQEQQAILVLIQKHVIHNHTQNRCHGDRRHLFYQTVDNYLVIWVYIYYHKIIHKHVLLSSHRRSNSSGNQNSDNKNNNKMIREKRRRVSIVSRGFVRRIW